jgi:phosphoribosyl 1,2-cyclic phosphate phosphodiesterase
MRFTFLGTSAGEQYPGFWCRCENCERARQLGGRNTRKNSCAHIAPDTLIDFPPEIFMQAERFGVAVIETHYLLVTHSHQDHYSAYPLTWRRMPVDAELPPPSNVVGPRWSPLHTLHVCGNEAVCDALTQHVRGDPEEWALEIRQAEPLQEFELGPMRVIPLRANHPDAGGNGLNYIIEREGKTILYAADTGWFLPETYEEIAKHRYDLAVVEGTFGFGADSEGHMDFRKLERVRQLFDRDALLKPGALLCATHIAPHFTPVHDEIAPIMQEKGITVAYDGMTVEL